MPNVLCRGPYRFFFFSGDRGQPPHVHVERDDREAKFWLDPVGIARTGGLSQRDINDIGVTHLKLQTRHSCASRNP
ncbi:MAG: DUF4160 domain-containing protein [Chloroflexota bacterium]|nr:DUF4160 domain-containing protein [Chloroflexota bacterium]MDE2958953.1 DUF4160 domain-containing protein [Chloroflexota bacterium]